MKKAILIILAVSLAQISAAQQYSIHANITGFKNGTKFYLQDLEIGSLIDSATIQNNRLVLKGRLSNAPRGLWFQTHYNHQFYYINLLIGNEAINIKGDIKDFPYDMMITGSKTQDDYNLLRNLTKANDKQREKLAEESFALKGDSAEIKSKRIWKIISKIDSINFATRLHFIKKHINSYTALNDLFYLKGKLSKDTVKKLYHLLTPTFKQNRFGKSIATYLKVGDALKQGDKMVDFAAIDKTGKKHHLADSKGKYILLDFATTYCGPCILSETDLKKIAKQYAGRLDIISFSGDGGKAYWLNGVNRDKPEWPSLWDGKGTHSETILKYGVSIFPTFFLIDPQGTIISKWIGYGKNDDGRGSLETDVEKMLSEKSPVNNLSH